MTWKYGFILVDHEKTEDFETKKIFKDRSKPLCMLVELHTDSNNNYTIFKDINIWTLAELENACRDIKRDGICTYFYENGTFEWENNKDHCGYKYYPRKENSCSDVKENRVKNQ